MHVHICAPFFFFLLFFRGKFNLNFTKYTMQVHFVYLIYLIYDSEPGDQIIVALNLFQI